MTPLSYPLTLERFSADPALVASLHAAARRARAVAVRDAALQLSAFLRERLSPTVTLRDLGARWG